MIAHRRDRRWPGQASIHHILRGVSGQALVEFTLTLPILVVLSLGIFDFGRAIWYYNTLAELAQEGTRYAIVHGAASSSPVGPSTPSFTPPDHDTVVEAKVRQFGIGMDAGEITVLSTWPDGDNKTGHRVSVEVRYTYTPLTTQIVSGMSVTLSSTSVGTILY